MAKMFITAKNHLDSTFHQVRLSGGSWVPTLPLSNLLQPRFDRIARTADVSLTSTIIVADLGTTRDVRLVAIPRGTFSKSARWRLTASTADDFSAVAYQSGWMDVFGVIYPFGSLPLGHPCWLDGKMSDEDAATAVMPAYLILPDPVLARWWRIEIDDRQNPAGHLDLHRLFICPGWQPSRNFIYGAAIGWEDPSTVTTSMGGVDFLDERPGYRVARLSLTVPTQEAFALVFDMLERGRKDQRFFSWNSDDVEHRHRRSFVCTMRTLSLLEAPFYGNFTIPIELKEVR